MAATFNMIEDHELNGMKVQSFRVTADAATAVYTFPHAAAGAGPPILLGITNPVKSTGTAAQLTAIYVEATGVMTIGGLTANDVIEFSVMMGKA